MSNSTIAPDEFIRRSFVYRKFKSSHATWSKLNNYSTVSSLSDLEEEVERAHNLALCDLSFLQRIGFKGTGACEWLEKQNIKIPENINVTLANNDDCLIARLGNNDILILESIKQTTNAPEMLEQKWHHDYAENASPCGFIMPRQDSHTCFSITGDEAPDMFAKLCAIDLRTKNFNNNTIAQTSLARLGAIIIRHDLNARNDRRL